MGVDGMGPRQRKRSNVHACSKLRDSTTYLFLPAAKPAGLWIANVKLGVDSWLFGGLDAFRGMLAQVSELARIKYDVS